MEPIYVPSYTDGNKLDLLKQEVSWIHPQALRAEAFMADDPLTYQYVPDGYVYVAGPFHPFVKEIMEKLNADYGCNLNVCFLNFYEDQSDALGWHSDKMDDNEPIVSVSFGQAREIWWRPIGSAGVIPESQRQLLGDGSMFMMPPGFQKLYQHRIPKGDRQMGARVSLTFRRYA